MQVKKKSFCFNDLSKPNKNSNHPRSKDTGASALTAQCWSHLERIQCYKEEFDQVLFCPWLWISHIKPIASGIPSRLRIQILSVIWLGPWNCSLLIRGHWVLDEESKTKWFSQNFVNKAEQKETKTKLFPSNLANEAEYKMTVGYLLLTQIALKWPTCSFPANVIICLTSVLLLRQMDH